MALNIELLETSFEYLQPKAGELADRFYDRLFDQYPAVRPLFKGPMNEQKKHLLSVLVYAVDNLRRPEVLAQALFDMGGRHVQYGAQPEHYPLVGQVLLRTMAEVAGDAWSDEIEQAWAEAYGVIAELMLKAYPQGASGGAKNAA